MQFIRTRQPLVLKSLRLAPPRTAVRASARPRTAEWSELVGACTLIATFLVMAMFG